MPKIERSVTICFLIRDGKLALASKIKGFGKNRLNGYGGKLKPGESVEDAAIRELFDESGERTLAKKEDLIKVAVIDFFFNTKPEWNQRAHIFLLRSWVGDPGMSEEMGAPEWFSFDKIPYHTSHKGYTMWPEDALWLPRILAGEKLKGEIYFKDEAGNAEHAHFEALT